MFVCHYSYLFQALQGGAETRAIISWTSNTEANLSYEYDEIHGKVLSEGCDEFGGMIIVSKRNCALIGAEVVVRLKRAGKVIAKIFLETTYGGSSQVKLLFGDRYFEKYVVSDIRSSSSALLLTLKTTNDQ